ncbi:suppressor of fused domain protein [Nocardioides caeni]|uniref:Suppressor of fused domain protein n=1 Tax=Nocardioides caeni TaxID=574700 RepID=A0A4S8N041_9ACTN|nr:suppressor of fused domain protein [Nocardioides caeni]THV09083.1 suppressor of fused domain protein [Nocardioides caeni]
MSREQYAARTAAEDDWAPGWEAIDSAFAAVYGDQEPRHSATNLAARAMFGGPEHLDGVSVFVGDGYLHAVSYGMSDLYADLESYGRERSGWGYELTTKVRTTEPEIGWAIGTMANLARYTAGSGRWFEPFQVVAGGSSIRQGYDSAITSYLVVPDTTVAPVDSLHGRLEFLQLVGVTTAEADWVAAADTPQRCRELATRLSRLDPYLATDLDRRDAVG